MPGRFGPDEFIDRSGLRAAGIAGHDFGYAADMLEHALQTPKAAAGENGRLTRWGGGLRGIQCRNGNGFIDRIGLREFESTHRSQNCGQRQDGKALIHCHSSLPWLAPYNTYERTLRLQTLRGSPVQQCP